MWHAIEWAFLMGVLAWVFVRLWSDGIYDPSRSRGAHARLRRSWWRARTGDESRPPAPGPDDGPGTTAP
jgi:hypothetical protein